MAEPTAARRPEPAAALVVRPVDPQALIAQAIDKGAAIDTVERLVALAKDVRDVQARDAWYGAMADFQQQCPSIKKTSTARIQSARGNYTYNYAPLEEIMATVTPVMAPLGLSVSWRTPKIEHGSVVVSCRIAHRMGHHEDSGDLAMPIGDDRGTSNPAQRVASAITYAKRYTLLGVLGLAPEDDDDAAAVAPDASQPTRRDDRPVPGAPPVRETFPSDEQAEREARDLFTAPEEKRERTRLMQDAQRLAKKLNAPVADREAWKKTYLGTAELMDADTAALVDLVNFMRSRCSPPEPVWPEKVA